MTYSKIPDSSIKYKNLIYVNLKYYLLSFIFKFIQNTPYLLYNFIILKYSLLQRKNAPNFFTLLKDTLLKKTVQDVLKYPKAFSCTLYAQNNSLL